MPKSKWPRPLWSPVLCSLIALSMSGCGAPADPASEVSGALESTPEPTPEETVAPAITTLPEPVELEPLPEPDGAEGTYSIAQTMKLAHENKLYRKLFKSPVDAEVAERLTLLYSGLPKQTSPKGDQEDWVKRAQALADSAQQAIAGDEEGVAAFRKAVNCNSCHSRHRP